MRKLIVYASAVLSVMLLSTSAIAKDDTLIAWWKFDEGAGQTTLDNISQIEDMIKGNFQGQLMLGKKPFIQMIMIG